MHIPSNDPASAEILKEAKVHPVDVPEEHLDSKEAPGDRIQVRQTSLFDFANTEAIKNRVRAAKVQPDPYNVFDFYKKEGFFQWLAKHPRFENVTLGIIVINALWISIDTDLNKADTIIDAKLIFVVADCLFFGYFSVEIFVRFCAFEKKCNCLRDGWFKFDSILMALYAFDPFAIGLMAHLQDGGGMDLPTAVLRLFRLARLSRLVRMLRSLPELMVMIKGMLTATSSVCYTLGLLILITYVFAIALRNLVPEGDGNDGSDGGEVDIELVYFSNMLETMHNLIIFGTFMDALSDFIWAIKEKSIPCLILTWMYICLASLTVLNMLIGVLCEVISAVAVEEKESMMVDKVYEKFGDIVNELDKNSDGRISWSEFQAILDHPGAMKALESVNVDAEAMVELAEDFFFENGNQVSVSFDEFMELVLDLRGGQQVTMKDMMGFGKRVSSKFQTVGTRMDSIDAKLDEILKNQKKLGC